MKVSLSTSLQLAVASFEQSGAYCAGFWTNIGGRIVKSILATFFPPHTKPSTIRSGKSSRQVPHLIPHPSLKVAAKPQPWGWSGTETQQSGLADTRLAWSELSACICGLSGLLSRWWWGGEEIHRRRGRDVALRSCYKSSPN